MTTVRTNLGTAAEAPYNLRADTVLTPNVSYLGDTWTRMASGATNPGDARTLLPLNLLKNYVQYQGGWEFANDTAAAINVQVDWCDGGSSGYIALAPGERKRIHTTPSGPSPAGPYDNTYRFMDISLVQVNTSVLFRALLLEEGSVQGPYFSGSTPNENGKVHEWTGAVNNSPSIETAYSVITRQNLCSNPSFEKDTANWTPKGGNVSLATSTAQKNIGNQSLLVTATGTSPQGTQLADTSWLVIGQWYTFSAYVYVPAGQPAVTTTAFSVGYGSNTGQTTGTWVRLSYTYQCTATNQSPGFDWTGNPAVGNYFYVDNVLIEPVSVVQTYLDGATVGTQFKKYAWAGAANASASNEYSVLDSPADSLSLDDLEYGYWKALSKLASGSLADVKKAGLLIATGLSSGSISDLELAYWKSKSGLSAGSIQDHLVAATSKNERNYYASFFK